MPSNAVIVGLLLPFTGASLGTANNFERAALFAEERVNEAGGINGRPLRVVSADTHSNSVRAQSSVEALVSKGATAIVGPESAEIGAEIRPYLAAQGVTFLSPLVGAASVADLDCSTPWFRLAPSAQDLGEALAKQIVGASVKDITVMCTSAAYDQALCDSLVARFSALKGSVRLRVLLDPHAQSYADEISAARAADSQAIVLASSLATGALLASEFYLRAGSPPAWFLSPLLKTDLLLENAVPDALEGARGVAPKVEENGHQFSDAFSERWQGEQPLEGANFYYDTVALLGLALSRIALDPASNADFSGLAGSLRSVSAPPGSVMGWDELVSGLARQREGTDVYYSGLTGPLLFRACGARAVGASSTWSVHAGKIITDED